MSLISRERDSTTDHDIPLRFVSISPLEEPTEMGEEDNIFITRSLDATSHVETIVEDVRDVWKRATKGKELVLKSRAPDEGAQIQE